MLSKLMLLVDKLSYEIPHGATFYCVDAQSIASVERVELHIIFYTKDISEPGLEGII